MRFATALLALAVVCVAFTATAEVSDKMGYQGVLRDGAGNVVPDGTYDITFRLYNVDVGGTILWEETQSLSVEGGIVNAFLGSVVPLGETLDFDEPYWMGISIEAEAELSPRTPLTTVPYAARAVHVDEPSPDDDWVIVGDDMYADIAGGVGIGDTTPEWLLDVHHPGSSNNYMQLTNAVTGDATYTGLLVGVSGSGSGWVSFSGAEALHLGRGSATNSVSVHSDGDVSVGLITDPDGKLDVDGQVKMEAFKMPTGAFAGAVLMSDADGVGSWQPFLSATNAATAHGNVVLDENGEATIELPRSLRDEGELRYQLTCIGGFAPVYVAEKARGGMFVIAGGEPGMEISWQVTDAR